MGGKEAAEIVESVGEAGPTKGGGAGAFTVRRCEIVPEDGDELISGALPVGVGPSARIDAVDSPRGRGVLKCPGLCGDPGSAAALVRGVVTEPAEDGDGIGGSGCGSGLLGRSLSLELSNPGLDANRLELSV